MLNFYCLKSLHSKQNSVNDWYSRVKFPILTEMQFLSVETRHKSFRKNFENSFEIKLSIKLE